MLVTADALELLFPAPTRWVSSVLQSSADLQTSIDEFSDYLTKLEKNLQSHKDSWPSHIAEGLDIAASEPFDQIDLVISYYEHKEIENAKNLREHRALMDSSRGPMLPQVKALMERYEQFLVDGCEALRDGRWDLMAVRASRPSLDQPVAFQNSSELRRFIGSR